MSAQRPRMSASTILAIDTATDQCSVAVLLGERLFERTETVGQKHSERTLPLVDAVLGDAGLLLRDIDAFAFGAGPGSFTGLRIACGVVQGLAYGCDRPVVGVGNLRAMALLAFAQRGQCTTMLAAIDARMHETYCGVYRNDAVVTEVRAPALEAPALLSGIVVRTSTRARPLSSRRPKPAVTSPISITRFGTSRRWVAGRGLGFQARRRRRQRWMD